MIQVTNVQYGCMVLIYAILLVYGWMRSSQSATDHDNAQGLMVVHYFGAHAYNPSL